MSAYTGVKIVVASVAMFYAASKVADKIIDRRNARILYMEKRLFSIMGSYLNGMSSKDKERFVNNKMTQNAIKDFENGLRSEEQVRQVLDFVKQYMV